MLSRREFVIALTRFVPLWGGFGSALSLPPWQCLSSAATAWATGVDKNDLIAQAPVARYWTSVEQARGNCRTCHEDGDSLQGRRHSHESGLVKCLLCAQGCVIRSGEKGKCRARMNLNGQLRSLVYGRPVAVHTDPVEKKPFYHFLPGAAAFSLATTGCPLSCKFCQNWEISQAAPEDFAVSYVPPSAVVGASLGQRAPVIAFTYNEPTVFLEYMVDIARIARRKGIRSSLISCGFMGEAPLLELCRVLDAIKIDLKGFSPSFYRNVCKAELQPVLKTIKIIARQRVHLEIVNLVVPTLNDSDGMLRGLIDWIMGEVGPDIPVHFTRFHPHYQLLNLPPTPVATLEKARSMAMAKGIRYAYVGNVPNHPGNHTYCPHCKKVVIKRSGFFLDAVHMKDGRCSFCRQKIAGVWA